MSDDYLRRLAASNRQPRGYQSTSIDKVTQPTDPLTPGPEHAMDGWLAGSRPGDELDVDDGAPLLLGDTGWRNPRDDHPTEPAEPEPDPFGLSRLTPGTGRR